MGRDQRGSRDLAGAVGTAFWLDPQEKLLGLLAAHEPTQRIGCAEEHDLDS